ncbi:hypothetical protein CN151_10875 [Sinorhizobium meliloti]|uniref:hypothetical protein n=1 Tax=Rhizobium meliloti TaxID=382 RepID=UPI000FD2B240|nr:hypothetical protein [Sinorhizobium meliloti]RVL05138.1 hypothetical protein CN151_10875 [Sinorhizobium meliloti]
MTDRPILFSAPMVRALLDDRKTQTRRTLKPQPDNILEGQIPRQLRIAIGDRLWVRESFRGSKGYDAYPPSTWSHWPVHYEADCAPDPRDELEMNGRLRPGIHMPRWASRLALIVTDVRVERLQDISEADAMAEGIEQDSDGWRDYLMPHTQCCGNAIDSYGTLWDHINGAGAWEANPWVAAYSFRVIKQNIDQIEKVAA